MLSDKPQEITTEIPLSGELDIAATTALKAELLEAGEAPVRINASQVERVGTQCVQLLLSAATSWREQGRDFAITDRSDAFESALDQLGIRDL